MLPPTQRASPSGQSIALTESEPEAGDERALCPSGPFPAPCWRNQPQAQPRSQAGVEKSTIAAAPRLPRRHVRAAIASAFDKRFELFATRRMTQLAQRFGLDLPNALAGYFEVLTDFLEGMVAFFADPKA